MVPILMLNKIRSATQSPQGTHLPHRKYLINQSTHISRDLAVLCCGIPITSLCMIQHVTIFYYSHIPLLSAYKNALYTHLSLCVESVQPIECLKNFWMCLCTTLNGSKSSWKIPCKVLGWFVVKFMR